MEPGIGNWRVVQNDGAMAVTNSVFFGETNIFPGSMLIATGQVSVTAGDLALIKSNAVAAAPGLCYLAKIRQAGNNASLYGFERSTITGTLDGAALTFNGANVQISINGNPYTQWQQIAHNQDYEIAIVLGTKGTWYFIRGGEWDASGTSLYGFADWTLAGFDYITPDATLYPCAYIGGPSNTWIDSIRLVQLGSEWTNKFNCADDFVESSTNGSVITMSHDSMVDHTITAATGVEQELRARIRNPSNYICLRMNQTESWSKLIHVTDGTETQISSNAQTFANGTKYRAQIFCWGSNVLAKIATSSRGTSTTMPVFTNDMFTAYSSHAGSNFVSWQLNPTNTIGPAPRARKILTYGDSKMFGAFEANSITIPFGALAGWQRMLQSAVNTNNTLTITMARSGLGGMNVGQLANMVTNRLISLPRVVTPEFICVNMGANDCATTVDTAFTNNYATVLDRLHEKFPAAKVYVVGIWVRPGCVNQAAIRGCATTLISQRSEWCFAGPDESVYLENGDGGASLMHDGTHPNHAGYIKTAEQWRAVLGL
jgi:lysophospholipase L1-like esterase